MKRTLVFSLFFLTFFPLSSFPAAKNTNVITMTFPQAVIADAIRRTLPLTFNGISPKLEGTITISDISNIRIQRQMLSCHLSLTGNNLNLITNVAGQNIRLQLGSASLAFDCDAQIRYDARQRRLFIRPVAKGLNPSQALQKGDIGQGLLLFLNGQEYAVALQDLQPLVAQTSNKIITVTTRISDIRAVNGALEINLLPLITATSQQ